MLSKMQKLCLLGGSCLVTFIIAVLLLVYFLKKRSESFLGFSKLDDYKEQMYDETDAAKNLVGKVANTVGL